MRVNCVTERTKCTVRLAECRILYKILNYWSVTNLMPVTNSGVPDIEERLRLNTDFTGPCGAKITGGPRQIALNWAAKCHLSADMIQVISLRNRLI